MRINHNIAALNTYNKLSSNQQTTSKSLEKLSSGLKINRAGDDAAGLAISEKMRGQIRGLDMASKNANDGISLISTAEGALNETHSILQRMRELAVQSGNDTNTESDRGEMQKELNQLTSEISRIGNTTEFNTQKLLKGVATGAVGPLSVTTVATASVPGVYNFDFTAPTVAGEVLKIGGETFTFGSDTGQVAIGANSAATITNLKAAISAAGNTYNATGTGNNIVLTQKSAAVSDAPTVSITANFSANLQIGANQGQGFEISISDMRSGALAISGTSAGGAAATTGAFFTIGTGNQLADVSNSGTAEYGLDIMSSATATAAITVLDDAISNVSGERSKLGAYHNRLEHTINNLGTSAENLSSAESRIRDVDMAKEMMDFTKNNILSQAAQAMLAQANQQPQSVLQLLQ